MNNNISRRWFEPLSKIHELNLFNFWIKFERLRGQKLIIIIFLNTFIILIELKFDRT